MVAATIAAISCLGAWPASSAAPARHAAQSAVGSRPQAVPSGPSCGGRRRLVVAGHRWTCTFDDEFNKSTGDPARLDHHRWRPQRTSDSGFRTGPDQQPACYVAASDVIAVGHGKLRLSVRQRPHPLRCRSGSEGSALNSGGSSFSTRYVAGMVSTYHRFSQTYGRFAVRAKLPAATLDGSGLQETFWLWPNQPRRYGGWPKSGEIDFAEFYSKYPQLVVPYIHYGQNPLAHRPQANINTVTGNCPINPRRYNTYVAQWVPGRLRLLVNGQVCVADNYQPLGLRVPAPFNAPFFLALTQAIGVATNAFVPGQTHLPATTKIDYVRIWGSR